jgi:hypothetical protein
MLLKKKLLNTYGKIIYENKMYNSIIKLLSLFCIPFDEINHKESVSCSNSKKFREEAGLD